jgi:hypothetical protein
MKKLYWFYRRERLNSPYDLNQVTLNWSYTMSFFLSNQYADYVSAWLISIKDMEIQEDRYTKEIAPWIKDLREFVIYEYNEDYVDLELMNKIISKIWNRFDLELLTIEEAKIFIRKNTNLEEIEEWKFLISKETEMMWEIIPAKYLIID